MDNTALFKAARNTFHARLLETILKVNEKGVPTNADKDSKLSVEIAQGIASALQAEKGSRIAGQTSGNNFEVLCAGFLKETFLKLQHLRPGSWDIHQVAGRSKLAIADFEQYAHLVALDKAAKENQELAAALGSDYTISPDIVIARIPETDEVINQNEIIIDGSVNTLSDLRKRANNRPLLHASISCKWTIRSDRAQNARSEALNLIRNRKGRLPHIAAVTAEPLPSRLASIALGTGDIDCVYHFALYELQQTITELGKEDAAEMLDIMVKGKRLKDISDLPLDLAI
ncbi:NgoMIV family type II restriction endonuclease [Eikenella halliae]|uniref:NgoMIV family type II restriction endonuclease n=1 Tax=Eikenella halliae TaxID=1795832 RepID=UPI00360D41BD